MVQSNLHQGATVGYYFTKLGIVPYKFIHTSHLDKIKELGIVKKCAVHCTYILKEDALRVGLTLILYLFSKRYSSYELCSFNQRPQKDTVSLKNMC